MEYRFCETDVISAQQIKRNSTDFISSQLSIFICLSSHFSRALSLRLSHIIQSLLLSSKTHRTHRIQMSTVALGLFGLLRTFSHFCNAIFFSWVFLNNYLKDYGWKWATLSFTWRFVCLYVSFHTKPYHQAGHGFYPCRFQNRKPE